MNFKSFLVTVLVSAFATAQMHAALPKLQNPLLLAVTIADVFTTPRGTLGGKHIEKVCGVIAAADSVYQLAPDVMKEWGLPKLYEVKKEYTDATWYHALVGTAAAYNSVKNAELARKILSGKQSRVGDRYHMTLLHSYTSAINADSALEHFSALS